MENGKENRNILFDNLKCLLIFLVVYAHFIENFQSIYASEPTFLRFMQPFIEKMLQKVLVHVDKKRVFFLN